MAEDKQQPVASKPQKAPKYEKDGDVKMISVDNEDPIEGKLIKIYHFSIDKLSEDNARYWFHAIEKQLRTQYAWQAIELHVRIRNEAYADRLVRKSNWLWIDIEVGEVLDARSVLARRYGRQEKGRRLYSVLARRKKG